MTQSDTLKPFKVIGISIRTVNAEGRAVTDLGALWGRFYAEKISMRIPNKADDDIYAVYTDYDLDHEGAYTTIIGCKVRSFDGIPEGMTGKEIGGDYTNDLLPRARCLMPSFVNGRRYGTIPTCGEPTLQTSKYTE